MKRKQNAKMKRDNTIRKIHQSVCGEVPLDMDQNDEMCDVISNFEEKCQVELKELFAEGEKLVKRNVRWNQGNYLLKERS